MIDEFGNYWIVKSAALADGGDLAGLRDDVEGRYEALCGNGFHPAVLEVIVRSDLEKLRNAQDIEPEMVPQGTVKLAKMVEQSDSLTESEKLEVERLAAEEMVEYRIEFGINDELREAGVVGIRPTTQVAIEECFGGREGFVNFWTEAGYSREKAEAYTEALYSSLEEAGAGEAWRRAYQLMVYHRGQNDDLFSWTLSICRL